MPWPLLTEDKTVLLGNLSPWHDWAILHSSLPPGTPKQSLTVERPSDKNAEGEFSYQACSAKAQVIFPTLLQNLSNPSICRAAQQLQKVMLFLTTGCVFGNMVHKSFALRESFL